MSNPSKSSAGAIIGLLVVIGLMAVAAISLGSYAVHWILTNGVYAADVRAVVDEVRKEINLATDFSFIKRRYDPALGQGQLTLPAMQTAPLPVILPLADPVLATGTCIDGMTVWSTPTTSTRVRGNHSGSRGDIIVPQPEALYVHVIRGMIVKVTASATFTDESVYPSDSMVTFGMYDIDTKDFVEAEPQVPRDEEGNGVLMVTYTVSATDLREGGRYTAGLRAETQTMEIILLGAQFVVHGL